MEITPQPFGPVNADVRPPLAIGCEISGKAAPIDDVIPFVAPLSSVLNAEGAFRSVIDCNRRLENPRLILAPTDGEPVPGNVDLAHRFCRAWIDGVCRPYHGRLFAVVVSVRQKHRRPMFRALYSFTRHCGGTRCPRDAGPIWHERNRMSDPLITVLGVEPDLAFGSNAPCSGRDGVYTLDRRTCGTGIEVCGVEIAEDPIEDAADRALWADRRARARSAVAGTLG